MPPIHSSSSNATNNNNNIPHQPPQQQVHGHENGMSSSFNVNMCNRFFVDSPNVNYTPDSILADYIYQETLVQKVDNLSDLNRSHHDVDGQNEARNGDYQYASMNNPRSGQSMMWKVVPVETKYQFKTERKVTKLGLMMVGWGGNNGSTLTASILANKNGIHWQTKEGTKTPNYHGSITQSSTVKLGMDENGHEIYVPLYEMLPMVHPNDLVISGWDINSADLGQAMKRAQVLDYDLQRQLMHDMSGLKPLPSVYYPEFIAANQRDRADNLINGTKHEQLEQLRRDIREFKKMRDLDLVIVLWTANTERYADLIDGVNDTADHLLKAIEGQHPEVSPSTLFAVASILEGAPFINGSPQNTLVPGVIDLAEKHRVFIGGDDFKSGQTKLKSVLVDFLVNAGIKPVAITSYNHLGNNDGKNLSAPEQFRSKEVSKSNVVDDMVAANPILYKKGEHPDHTVVIKYCPAVGDSKRALDEYVSEIFMGGKNTISIYNVCEDSLLASPLILDLAILTELMTRISYKTDDMSDYEPFHSVLSILSYLLKAPVVPPNTPVINALNKQRHAIENILRACVGLPPENDMMLRQRAFH